MKDISSFLNSEIKQTHMKQKLHHLCASFNECLTVEEMESGRMVEC